MTIISTTYGPGGYDPEQPNDNIVEQVADNGDGTVTVTTWTDGTPSQSTRQRTEAEQLAAISAQVEGNRSTLASRALDALASLRAYVSTVAARRTGIDTARTAAQARTTVTLGNLAGGQTEIRALWTMMAQIAGALEDLNDQSEANAKQIAALIRLQLSELDDIDDTEGTAAKR